MLGEEPLPPELPAAGHLQLPRSELMRLRRGAGYRLKQASAGLDPGVASVLEQRSEHIV